jgi:TetR/AcrR family transcriptional regulator
VANAARPELLRMMAVEASIESDRLSYLFERYIEPTTLSVGRVFQSLVDEGALHDLPPGTLFFLIAHGATAPAGHAPLARRVGVQDGSDPVVALRHAEAVVDAILAGLQPRGR